MQIDVLYTWYVDRSQWVAVGGVLRVKLLRNGHKQPAPWLTPMSSVNTNSLSAALGGRHNTGTAFNFLAYPTCTEQLC
jgi:hypothetical protein